MPSAKSSRGAKSPASPMNSTPKSDALPTNSVGDRAVNLLTAALDSLGPETPKDEQSPLTVG